MMLHCRKSWKAATAATRCNDAVDPWASWQPLVHAPTNSFMEPGLPATLLRACRIAVSSIAQRYCPSCMAWAAAVTASVWAPAANRS